MNPFLPFSPVNAHQSDHLTRSASRGATRRWGLAFLLLTSFSYGSWGQCFTTTTLPLPADDQPNALAVSDLNGDGKLDLVTASSTLSVGRVSVRLGDGQGGFGSPVSFPVGSSPQSVAIGDLNGDGKLDLVTASVVNTYLSVLLGNGLGGFEEAPNVPLYSEAISVALADFNGDNRADLVYAVRFFPRNTNTVFLQLNNGHGGFDAPINLVTGVIPNSVAVGDFNGDGRADLATANVGYGSSDISVLLGNGLGGFLPATSLNIAPGKLAVGDFTNDAQADLAIAYAGSPYVLVLPGNGAGGFGAPLSFTLEKNVVSVAIGDFNADQRGDLITVDTPVNTVSIRLSGTNTYYADQDGDTFGDATRPMTGCSLTLPAGYVTNKLDCDDHNAANIPTRITAQPISQSVEEKQSASFRVSASGYNLTYQWYFQGSGPANELKKETSPTLTIKHAKEGNGKSSDAGIYYVRVTGSCGSVLSDGASLSISSKKGRLAAEEPAGSFQVRLLGNPVVESVEVEVREGEKQPLQLSLTDMKGQLIEQQQKESAGPVEHYQFNVSSQPAGLLLLRVSSQGKSQTVRVLKTN
jgi:hypothetical protein